MTKYISFGNWNKKYFIVIFTFISVIIYRLIVGFSFGNLSSDYIINNSKFSGHYFIHYTFLYITILFISSIMHIISKYKNKKVSERPNNELIVNNQNGLIYNENYENINSTYSPIFVLFIIFLYILDEQALTTFKIYFKNCDFWMIELYILSYLNAKMFKIKIYSHQLLAILIDIIPIILKGVILGFSFLDEKNHWDDDNHDNYKYDINDPSNNKLKSLLVLYWPLLIFVLVLYFLMATLRSYVLISIKKFMDLKYISLNKILILYSLTGIIFCSLFATFTTFFSCGKNLKINNKRFLNDYQCKIKDDNYKYIDNFKVYFNNFKNASSTEFTNEMMFLPFAGTSFFFYKYFTILTVKELTPLHKVFIYPIQYFFQKLIISYKLIANSSQKLIVEQYFIDMVSDVVAFLGFLIYLEIIELNFCRLNFNIRKNIIKRGNKSANLLNESEESSGNSSINDGNDEDDSSSKIE